MVVQLGVKLTYASPLAIQKFVHIKSCLLL
jgi:hypothetical protein